MDDFAGIFEVLASDQHDARLASRKALVLSRDRIDARLGKFLAASRSPEEFDARYELVADDFAGIVRVAADEVGHEDPDRLVETLHAHYREAGKPPWLEEADSDEDSDTEAEEKPKSKKQKKKNKKKDKDSDDDEGDDSLEFAAKTAGAVPLQRTADSGDIVDTTPCPACDGTGEKDGQECSKCNGIGAIADKSKSSSVHVADKGNTGLAGPSPKMDKKRWTPKSVKPLDVPSERHPTVQKDILDIMPKENEGPPGDAHNLEEIWSLTTTETLPTATGLDDAGFAGNNQDMAPHTKTFGDGGQVDPVKSESLEA